MALFDNVSVIGGRVLESRLISENGVPRLISRDLGRVSGLPFDNKVRGLGGNIAGEMIGGHFRHLPGKPLGRR